MSEGQPKSALLVLKWPLGTALLGLVAAVLFVAGSYWHLNQEKKEDLQSRRALQDAQGRLANANKEVADLNDSVTTVNTLIEVGAFEPENRLDWVDAVNAMKQRHRLASLDYELAPQRSVSLPGGRSFAYIDARATRVRVVARALHDGELLAFLEELNRPRKGFYPIERCTIKMLESVQDDPAAPRIEADCLLDWMTIKDKRVPVVASAGTPK